MIKKILLTLLLVAGIAGSIVAITRSDSPTSSKRLQAAASYYPLYDFAKHVGGDKIDVTNLTPAGTEPHDYEPSPKVLISAQDSQVFIYNGGHMEPWAQKFLGDYSHTTVKASQGITLRPGQDPHFWLDPVLAQQIVNNIRDGLTKADPQHKDYYYQNAVNYNQQLAKLDKAFSGGLASCQQHTVISSHEAFSYLAARYNFTVEAIAGLSPEDEPSAERLTSLSTLVKDSGIRYVFFESLVSPRLADTIAQETGAQTLVFDPIEGLSETDQKQGKNYITIQYENLKNLQQALTCS
ncbi:MAG TPA: zinc ABC transporter substrate-binding protein [Candidatus Saccharimonadales bacterium]|nr:zinc ABC transporter substrate-binding protein [Candidatus Saccharimonadales bacterium]